MEITWDESMIYCSRRKKRKNGAVSVLTCLSVTVFERRPQDREGWAGQSLTGFIHRSERQGQEELKPASFI